MTTDLTAVASSINSARTTYAYGQIAYIPLASGSAGMEIRAGLPAEMSPAAVVTSATLVLTQYGAIVGSATVNLKRNLASWSASKVTWSNAPATSGSTSATLTKSGTAGGQLWSFDVTTDVQAFAAGTYTNFGWKVASTAAIKFRGSAASAGQPVLVLAWSEPGDVPEDLYPVDAAVSIAKPTLTFSVPPDTTNVQVQVDANATAPYDFDSGEIASDEGIVDLATTAYAGLSAGASTYWRAQTRGGTGLTGWSPWVQFSRTAKPTVAITSPGATSDDVTPPVTWTVTGATQEAWRVRILSGTQVAADSGVTAGTALVWTPPASKLLSEEGATLTVEVTVWDTVDRAATAGDPVYTQTTSTYTLSTSGGVTNPATCTATTDGTTPKVTVAATAASAPDGWAVTRDGVVVYVNKALPTTSFSWDDWTATPNHPHTYRASRIVTASGRSGGGPTATVTPRCQGIWLYDPADLTTAVIWGTDEGSFSADEIAAIHQPIAGRPIRRVAYRPPLSGHTAGTLVDVGSYTADTSTAALYDFKESPANRELRLILGDMSLVVNVGNILVSPSPLSGVERVMRVEFDWWQVDDVAWSG